MAVRCLSPPVAQTVALRRADEEVFAEGLPGMKCVSCGQKKVVIAKKPTREECRNPKCTGVKPALNATKLFPSLQKGKKK